jgi:quercetin dioxygenase-like cupin family protein/uncharacterized damage-inducible protein DinB
MISENAKSDLRNALNIAPVVVDALLLDTRSRWFDIQVAAGRFTLREVVAHLADWEEIFYSRLLQLLHEENPVLVGIDEWQMSIDNDNTHADFDVSLRTYAERRRRLLETIDKLKTSEWEKTGVHTETGAISATDLLIHMSAHDSYHQEQVIKWKQRFLRLDQAQATVGSPVTAASRTELSRRDIPGSSQEAALFLLELPPGGEAPVHKHPGIGVGYVLEGVYESQYEGEELKRFTAGDAIYDLAETPHQIARNGSDCEPLRFIMTFVVEKGGPTSLPI